MRITLANTTVLGCLATLLFKMSAKGSSGALQGTVKWSLYWQQQSLQGLQQLIEHMQEQPRTSNRIFRNSTCKNIGKCPPTALTNFVDVANDFIASNDHMKLVFGTDVKPSDQL